MSGSAFCRVHDLGLHRLRYWTSRRDRDAGVIDNETPPDFVVVPLERPTAAPSPPTPLPQAPVVEVRISDRVLVRLPMSAGSAALSEALRAVLEVTG